MSKPSTVVSGAGFAASFWVALDRARQERGLSDEQFYDALKDGSPLFGKIVDLVAEIVGRVKRAVFHVIINNDEPLEAKTASGFNYVNSNLTDKNFKKVVGKGRVEAEAVLVNFGEYVESDDAAVRLDKMGLRPGIPKELADLSKSNPDSAELAAHFPLAALGDSWQDPNDDRGVAYLYGRASSRELDLNYWGGRWHDDWWFLAFCK